MEPVTLYPGDFEIIKDAEGVSLKYTPSADARFSAAGWPEHYQGPVTVSGYANGTVTITPMFKDN